MLCDVRRQRPQRGEDAAVVLPVGAQLEAVAARRRQCQFQGVDGIQAQAVAEQRRFRVDRRRVQVLDVQRFDQQGGELAFGGGLGGGVHGGAGEKRRAERRSAGG